MTAAEIQHLRKRLGVSLKKAADLIGTTEQTCLLVYALGILDG